MALVNINADFKDLVKVLTRIAEAAERAWPPKPTHPVKKVELQDISRVSTEDRALAEITRSARREMGLED